MPGGDDGLTLLMCYLLPWHEEDSAELRDAMAVALLAYLHPHVDEESTRLQALLAAVDMHQTASNGRPEDAYKVKDVTLEILEREGCFNMTQVDAAHHLGFGSPTSIKAIMKRLGIKKWPFRKKSTINNMLSDMEAYMRRYIDPVGVDAVLQRARVAYSELEVYEKCTTGAPPPLAKELQALRQKVYRLRDQDKNGCSDDGMRRCVAQLVEKIVADADATARALWS